ncbi:MAG: SUMF1/EgtB/PvdO family nonheme iron enzyme [bacterium]
MPADKAWADGDFRYASVEPVPGASGYRLPTEAEWGGWPVRGRREAIYAGTLEILGKNNAPAPGLPIVWYGGNSGVEKGYDSSGWPEMQRPAKFSGTHPVGQKAANPWGLRDVLGNVYEWCWDWYAPYPPGVHPDPSGPPTGDHRVVRGGSWDTDARRVRSADRVLNDPVWRFAVIGFRLVRPPSLVEP